MSSVTEELTTTKDKQEEITQDNEKMKDQIQIQQEEATVVEGKFIELTEACEQNVKSKDRSIKRKEREIKDLKLKMKELRDTNDNMEKEILIRDRMLDE